MSVPALWHITISNFNEKARWALDYKGVQHVRRAPMPGAHMLVAFGLTRRVATFPVLELDGERIGDSTKIIAALEQRYPDPPLYPANPAERSAALVLEDFLDEQLGHDVRRVVFAALLQHPDLMRAMAGEITTPRQGRVLAAGLGPFSAMLRRRYSISEPTAELSRHKIEAALRLIEGRLGGGEHLVGDSFTVADLTAAALLAPMLGPEQFPYTVPTADFPPPLAAFADEARRSEAGQWVLRTYAAHRPASAELTAQPS